MCRALCAFYDPALEGDQIFVEMLCSALVSRIEDFKASTDPHAAPELFNALSRFFPKLLQARQTDSTVAALVSFTTKEFWNTPSHAVSLTELLCTHGLFLSHDRRLEPLMDAALASAKPSVLRQFTIDCLASPHSSPVLGRLMMAERQQLTLIPDLLSNLVANPESIPGGNPSVWSLLRIMELTRTGLATAAPDTVCAYLEVLLRLLPSVPAVVFRNDVSRTTLSSNSDSEGESDVASGPDNALLATWRSLRYLLTPEHASNCLRLGRLSGEVRTPLLSLVLYMLLDRCTGPQQRVGILNVIAFEAGFTRSLWLNIEQIALDTDQLKESGLILDSTVWASASQASTLPAGGWVVYLRLFCDVYFHMLLTMDDTEFVEGGSHENSDSFSVDEVVRMVKIVKDFVVGLFVEDSPTFALLELKEVRESAARLLKHLHGRDARQRFCPDSLWLSTRVKNMLATGILDNITVEEFSRGGSGFGPSDNESIGATDTVPVYAGVRTATVNKLVEVLKRLPFVVDFGSRALIFRALIADDRKSLGPELIFPVEEGGNHFFEIRRDRLYSDAFDKLHGMGRSLRSKTRVTMIDEHGLQEAGIDGGGVFREFLDEVVMTGFNPDFGLFTTTADHQISPNPQALVANADAAAHFEFLGMILGKSLYDGILMELPFASFFLAKLLGQRPYLNDLASLDPEMHKNLLFLKRYDGDIADLSLDFSISEGGIASGQVHDLIPGGRDVGVTNSNRIKYIYHVADFRLNRQIEKQCRAFVAGLFHLINREWFMMFSPQELQILIGGADAAIDIDDLKVNCNYGGIFDSGLQQHHTIQMLSVNIASILLDRVLVSLSPI